METLAMKQETIDKERNTFVLIKNRLGVESYTDLHTAKRLVIANEAEIIEEYSDKKSAKKTNPTESDKKSAKKTNPTETETTETETTEK